MRKGRRKGIKVTVVKEGRLSGQYKRMIAQDVMSHFANYYPDLTRVQIRRVLSYTYQSLRKGK